ncbi:putative alpha/beta-hydrolase family hydrolase [Catenulispora sp. MAP12-49]|uniref:alpha/beta hydrolase family protein n=1 Tax=unclassified Catenulispora TaxID=414885 RepID=UPI00351642B1
MSDRANSMADTGPAMEFVPTPVGAAGITWYPAPGAPRAVALLGHGTATGVEAADLQALAAALPARGVSVALVTQPYRMNRTRDGSDEPSLDTAWRAVWPIAADLGVPVISGGRSAGSQVACRTAERLGAHAVLALAYPLLGPGSSRELLATGRPTLVLQGTRDPFGRPEQFPALPAEIELVEIAGANHTFGTPSGTAHPETMALITATASQWIERQLART